MLNKHVQALTVVAKPFSRNGIAQGTYIVHYAQHEPEHCMTSEVVSQIQHEHLEVQQVIAVALCVGVFFVTSCIAVLSY